MKKNKNKYLIKTNSGINVQEISYFDAIKSYQHAFGIAVQCYLELQNIMIKDSVDNKESFVGKTPVISGLELSLREIDNRFPGVMQNIHSCYFNISRIARC